MQYKKGLVKIEPNDVYVLAAAFKTLDIYDDDPLQNARDIVYSKYFSQDVKSMIDLDEEQT